MGVAEKVEEIFFENESMYDKMKRLGVDMRWYEKSRANNPVTDDSKPIPLTDDVCSMLSVYLIQKSGKMFTTTSDGEPYEHGLVRQGKPIERDIFYCACCKEQFLNYKLASLHYSKTPEKT